MYLQHVQERRLSRIIESKEQKFGVFVEQAQGCQDIVDYRQSCISHPFLSPHSQ